MSEIKRIHTPLDEKNIRPLKAGDKVFLSGEIFTARDQAHLKISEMVNTGEKLPLDFSGKIIYYCGPAPAGNRVIGSCGPTTSSRMDPFTPLMLEAGMKGMIGKGRRSKAVVDAVKQWNAIYFLAPGGAGAYLSERVKSCEVVAFEYLGPEAIYRLEVEDFPLIVGIDHDGQNVLEGKGAQLK